MAALSISSSLDSLAPRRDRVLKALSDLHSQRELLSACIAEWTDLDQHFSELEASIRSRLQELDEKEKAFEAKTTETKQTLDKREEAISVREQASLARVQEQKDAAIAAIFEEKRKLEERHGKSSQSAAATTGDQATTAKVEVKTALNGSASQAMEVDAASTKVRIAASTSAANGASKATASTNDAGANQSKTVVRPELQSLCESMDGEGLRKFLVDHRRDVGALRNELPSALQSAIDPSRLVLKALEGYHLLELDPSLAKKTGASANRRACILLLECLALLLADPVLGVDHPVVPTNIKESAKEVANLWKSNRDVRLDAGNDNALDAQAFLQLLATFGIASEFDSDELCKLVTSISRRKQTPVLCRSLGLTAKIPDLVEKLGKDGKQIEALSFAHAFGIMDKAQPVTLLKSYLKEARKAAQALAKNAPSPAAAQNDSTVKELFAIKNVIQAVEEYKLESQFSTENLKKRVENLEKAKADRKRAAAGAKVQAKKPRQSGAPTGGAVTTPVGAAPANRSGFTRPSDRGLYGGAGIASYGLANQNSYDRRPQAGYTSVYGADSRNPVSLSSSYLYSADGLGSSLYGTGSSYLNPSPSYGSYAYGNGLDQTTAAYQSYLR